MDATEFYPNAFLPISSSSYFFCASTFSSWASLRRCSETTLYKFVTYSCFLSKSSCSPLFWIENSIGCLLSASAAVVKY